MFYLINEKDGLSDESFLINLHKLEQIEVGTSQSSKNLNLHIHINFYSVSFNLNSDDPLNVTAVLENISNMERYSYSNDFIVLTDVGNHNIVNKHHGPSSKLHSMVCSVLLNIREIGIAYQKKENGKVSNFIYYQGKDVPVKESPEEIMAIISKKIIPNPLIESPKTSNVIGKIL